METRESLWCGHYELKWNGHGYCVSDGDWCLRVIQIEGVTGISARKRYTQWMWMICQYDRLVRSGLGFKNEQLAASAMEFEEQLQLRLIANQWNLKDQ